MTKTKERNGNKGKKKAQEHVWSELLPSRIADFQGIIKQLVAYDDSIERYKKYGDEDAHWIRKAVSVANPKTMRVFWRQTDNEYTYLFIVSVDSKSGGSIYTAQWFHEDGISRERKDVSLDSPIHKVVSVGDLIVDSRLPVLSDTPDGFKKMVAAG